MYASQRDTGTRPATLEGLHEEIRQAYSRSGQILPFRSQAQAQAQAAQPDLASPSLHVYSGRFKDKYENGKHEIKQMTKEEQQEADELLRALANAAKLPDQSPLGHDLRDSQMSKILDAFKKKLGSSKIEQRPLREYILEKLSRESMLLFGHCNHAKGARLYVRYIDPDSLDTKKYNHATVVLRAKDGEGNFDHQRLVSDLALLKIMPNIIYSSSCSSDHPVMVKAASNNLERMRTENPWCHVDLVATLAQTIKILEEGRKASNAPDIGSKAASNLYKTIGSLKSVINKEIHWLRKQYPAVNSNQPNDIRERILALRDDLQDIPGLIEIEPMTEEEEK